MSTLVLNRAHSASARTVRPVSTNNQASPVKQRPTTSGGVRRSPTINQTSHLSQRSTTSAGLVRSHTNVYSSDESTSLDFLPPFESTESARKRRILRRSTTANYQSARQTLTLRELTDLLQNAAEEEPYICKIRCFSVLRKLVETIDIRKTPLDWKLLYELQKWENNIIQKNACGEARFTRLIDVLEPQYISEAESIDLKKTDARKLSIHRPSLSGMEYFLMIRRQPRSTRTEAKLN